MSKLVQKFVIFIGMSYHHSIVSFLSYGVMNCLVITSNFDTFHHLDIIVQLEFRAHRPVGRIESPRPIRMTLADVTIRIRSRTTCREGD